jgi:hypothetical protein
VRLRAIRAELFDPAIAAHHGRLVKTTGDGLLVEASSVVDALRCAAEAQAGMAERNATAVADKRIEFRIGIHQGDIVVDEGDIFGDGVNIAARLEGLAKPGGICVSARVQEDAAGKLDLAFEDMGEQAVKNIARPVRAFKVRTGASPSAVPAPRPTLPELPRRRLRAPRPVIVAASLAAVIGLAIATWWVWPRLSSIASVETSTTAHLHTSLGAANVKGSSAAAVPLLSFVVLPFANLSNDPEQDYFTDAITEDLTTDLSRIGDSFVIARNTAFAYKGKPSL